MTNYLPIGTRVYINHVDHISYGSFVTIIDHYRFAYAYIVEGEYGFPFFINTLDVIDEKWLDTGSF